jgi:hypothetical protein
VKTELQNVLERQKFDAESPCGFQQSGEYEIEPMQIMMNYE